MKELGHQSVKALIISSIETGLHELLSFAFMAGSTVPSLALSVEQVLGALCPLKLIA